MQNYMKTILSAFKTWTQKKIKDSTADWNENDSSKSSYVKNRTHWDSRTFTTTEEVTVSGNTIDWGYIKVSDSIDFDIDSVCKMTLYTSTGYYLEDVPVSVEKTNYGTHVVTYTDDYGEWWWFSYFATQQEADMWWDNDEDNPFGVGLYVYVDAGYGDLADVAYSFTLQNGELHQIDEKYLSMINRSNNIVFDEQIFDNSEFQNQYYYKLVGKHIVTIDGVSEDIEFIDNGDWSYADLSSSSFIYRIETWNGGVWFSADLDGNHHWITIKEDKNVVKDEYLPNNLATTDDVQEAADVASAAQATADTAIANAAAAKTTANLKMSKSHPTGTGSFNMNRKKDTTIGNYSVAIGYDTTASGNYSYAEGYNTIASGDVSHSSGEYNIAAGQAQFVSGRFNIADLNEDNTYEVYIKDENEDYHMASNVGCVGGSYIFNEKNGLFTLTGNVTKVGDSSSSLKKGKYFSSSSNNLEVKSIAYITTAPTSSSSFDFYANELAGRLKESLDTYAHIVGNGTSDTARSNAHTLDWEGNAWYSGDVYVGSTSGTNRDEGSKKLATVEEVQELASQISSQSYVAQTEAPEDKNLLWLDLDDESDDEGLSNVIQAAVADVKNVAIPAPEVAEVGQTIVVKSVDENGKPVEWETMNLLNGDSIPETIEITVISEGVIPAGSDGTVSIDTGVTWGDLKDYDWFEIAIGTNVSASGQKYYFFNRSTPPEAWRRFMLINGYIGKARFKKIANGVYEWFSQSNAIAVAGVTRNTSDYDNFPVALNGPLNSLVNFKHWLDTDKFYIYPSVQVPSDQTFSLCGIKFK